MNEMFVVNDLIHLRGLQLFISDEHLPVLLISSDDQFTTVGGLSSPADRVHGVIRGHTGTVSFFKIKLCIPDFLLQFRVALHDGADGLE